MDDVSTERITSSAAWVQGLLNMFASQGIDTVRLLAAAGIEPARLAQSSERFELEQLNQLWRLAVQASGQDSLGLDRTLVSRFLHFEIVHRSMTAGASLGRTLETMAQYLALTEDPAAFALEREHPNTWVAMLHLNDPAFPRQRVEYGMLSILVVAQRVTGQLLRPLAAEFVFPPPVDAHRHRMAFPCPLRFECPVNRLLFAGEDLALPTTGTSPSIDLLEERVLEALLVGLGPARTSFRVAQKLVERLRRGETPLHKLHAAIGLTEAQLARQLRAERSTVAQLLDRVRRELAREYLADTELLTDRIVVLLGLRDEEELTLACRRWFALTPADYRLR